MTGGRNFNFSTKVSKKNTIAIFIKLSESFKKNSIVLRKR